MGRGGFETKRFLIYSNAIFYSNQPNIVSNDRVGLYLPVETLKLFLCVILCPQGGAEVTKSNREKIIGEKSDLHQYRQYVHQMKAENILNSNLT